MKSLKTYFADSLKNGYCLGAYNFVNLETLKGICEGCKKTNSPALVCVSEGALAYLGEKFVKALFDSAKKTYNLPIFLHLDHGKTCCSGLTLALFLIYACEDPLMFLEELRYALENSEINAA